jgi:hypothetical protein
MYPSPEGWATIEGFVMGYGSALVVLLVTMGFVAVVTWLRGAAK